MDRLHGATRSAYAVTPLLHLIYLYAFRGIISFLWIIFSIVTQPDLHAVWRHPLIFPFSAILLGILLWIKVEISFSLFSKRALSAVGRHPRRSKATKGQSNTMRPAKKKDFVDTLGK